ncbi:MAG: hypothetical protein DLD55_05255 [candidate division SR1 bacterium]|nr:MAG: hypothetical protein DLD55_05255 [candidate division SR1 bacterium]
MTTQNGASVSFRIPGIDGGMAPINPQAFIQQEREKLDRLVNAPSTTSGWALLGKIALGVMVGALMSVILFMIMGAFGLAIGGANTATTGASVAHTTHPLARLILLFLGFLVTFLGNLILITLYGVFFSQKYTKIGKTIGLLLLTNSILFAGMIALFLLLQPIPSSEVLLFVVYVCLSLFISFSQMEFVVNPNYSASTLMGNTLGLCIALIVFGLIWVPTYDNPDKSSPYMLIWQSTLIAFPLMIFGQGIREIVYAKIYESGSNPFYLASKAELDTQTLLEHQAEEQAQEAVNVEL